MAAGDVVDYSAPPTSTYPPPPTLVTDALLHLVLEPHRAWDRKCLDCMREALAEEEEAGEEDQGGSMSAEYANCAQVSLRESCGVLTDDRSRNFSQTSSLGVFDVVVADAPRR